MEYFGVKVGIILEIGIGVMELNLAEMLLYADINHIKKIADHYQCQCDRHSKQDMIQSLIYKILQRQTMINTIKQVDHTEQTFILLLYLDQRNQFMIEDLLAKGKKAIQLHQSSQKPRDLILLSLKKGWIFQGVGKKNTLVYLIPEDLKSQILELIRDQFLLKMHTLKELPFYRDEKKMIAADCQTFLKFVANEEVVLTGDGNIYRRQQQLLFNQFLVPEEPIKKIGWRFGYGRRYRDYPDRFSLIYDYAYYKKFIEEDEKGFLYLTDLGRNRLDNGNLDHITMDIYKFWIRLYKSPIPDLPFIVRLIDLLTVDDWLLLEDLQSTILFWLKDRYYETREVIFNERIIKMLHHLGIIQIGQDQGKKYIRLTKDGHRFVHGFEMFQAKEIKMK
ncbi:hypothetical protein [Tepidibacillus fermentans]|uniref:hypothetical protein n=1 Tax=Tepidibacillus fermentans TaxID=1281767 RepID=UPI00104B4FCE|nr:hypothetical protein [Tepidibacillus fermentans]